MYYLELAQEKINSLTVKQVSFVVFLVGLIVFVTGLFNPFQGDDFLQIVQNVPVHSITNLFHFFAGGTFYDPGSASHLSGSFYRPLMSTTFSIIYTIFGAHVFFYHIVQLALYCGSVILLFIILKHLLRGQLLAFTLSLLFMVHPINSQIVFAIPSMQDALYFFFGMLGLCFLILPETQREIGIATLCFVLSLLSKETGILFIFLGLLYLLLWHKDKIKAFAATIVLPVLLWFIVRAHVAGLHTNPNNAPIDRLGLVERLYTAPSIVQFYISRILFPHKLAQAYYWVYPSFTVRHVLIPLLVDAFALCLIILLGYTVRKNGNKALFKSYLFFAAWMALGLATVLQILPLDMTVSETWIIFSLAGLIGLIGVLLSAFKPRINQSVLLASLSVVIVIFGVRTFVRGTDWSSTSKIDRVNISNSKEDYVAYNDIAYNLLGQKQFTRSESYARQSIASFPYFGNYNILGSAQLDSKNFKAAELSFNKGASYGNYADLYENLGQLHIFYGDEYSGKVVFDKALKAYPADAQLWYYYAIFNAENGHNAAAKVALENAVKFGYTVNPNLITVIDRDLAVDIPTNLGTIHIKK